MRTEKTRLDESCTQANSKLKNITSNLKESQDEVKVKVVPSPDVSKLDFEFDLMFKSYLRFSMGHIIRLELLL